MQILEFKEVNKNFGKKDVLNNVSFQIESGKIIGLLGPNGSGKTTIMKIIAKLLRPSSGEILINEKSFIKTLIEEPIFYKGLNGLENLRYLLASEKSIEGKNIKEIVDLLKMDSFIKKKVGQYSMGMRQKLAIAYAVIGEANFLVMDEPLNGLDPTAIGEVRDLLLKLMQTRNVTILISSHLLKELQGICSDVVLLNKGRVVGQYQLNANKKVFFRFQTQIDTQKAFKLIGGEHSVDPCSLTLDKQFLDISEAVFRLAETRVKITEIRELDEQIEEIYKREIENR